MSDHHGDYHNPDAGLPSAEEAQLAALTGDDDSTPEAEVEEQVSAPEVVRSTRSRTPMFSWNDVDSIVMFCQRFDSGDETDRRTMLEMFGWDPDSAAAMDLAQGVYPAGGTIEGYRLFSMLASKLYGGTMSFMDGVQITGQLAELDSDVIKAFVSISNVFGTEDIRYRRNIPVPAVLQSVMESLQAVEDRDRVQRSIQWIDAQLELWPGEQA